jgi:hypothetical protein
MAGTAGHGTTDVTRGGGEFGRGFYCHQKEARAWILVLNRYQQPAVLRLDIEDGLYNGLETVSKMREIVENQGETNQLAHF